MKPSIKQRWTEFKPCPMSGVRGPHDEFYKNDTHAVIVTPCNYDKLPEDRLMDGWVVLSIRRIDRAAECDWRIFQRIKNDLAGPEREAVQLFPAMSRVVDTSNQYFLMVAPKGYRIGLGYLDQLVVAHDAISRVQHGWEKSVQRPFDPDCPIGNLAAEMDERQWDGVFPIPLYPESEVAKYRRHHKEGADGNS